MLGSSVIGLYIVIMFAICAVLMTLISAQRISKMGFIIYTLVCLVGAIFFNDIIHESYYHYNSYKYLFIFAALYFIFVNATKDFRYKYIIFLASLCMGYILVILSLPIINIFRVYTIYNKNYPVGVFIVECMQSFVVTTLSLFLCRIVLFISKLFVLEETTKHFKRCILLKYLIYEGYLSTKLFDVKDRSTWPYRAKNFIIYVLGYLVNPKRRKTDSVGVIFKYIFIIVAILLLPIVYCHNPTRILRSQLQSHSDKWYILIDNTHNKITKLSSNNYINGFERDIEPLTLSSKSDLKYFNIGNNKLYIYPNVLSYSRLGKIDQKSPLIFDGVTRGAYHFSGMVNVKKNAHFSSKANINMYLSPNKAQIHAVRRDIKE